MRRMMLSHDASLMTLYPTHYIETYSLTIVTWNSRTLRELFPGSTIE